MDLLGNIFLHVALLTSTYAVIISCVGGYRKNASLVLSARNAVWATALLTLASAVVLVIAFLKDQYQLQYVYLYSNSTTPFFYKIAALWGGQDGSLLFWVLILLVFSSIVMFQNRRKNQEFLPYVIATLMVIASFFLILLVFSANPFKLMPYLPTDGRGLNPLLQNYYMVIHPPSLYLGYVGMSIPFSFGMAALVTGRLDNHWILQIRRWTLTAWFFLSLGNLLGASWAYEVLGWGGYWGWDPVENAAFIPWLTSTAFLHSVIIQERRGILKTWNMALVILSFLTTLIGTFLTRSGIISSVHSFAQSDIGDYFVWFLVLTLITTIGLTFYRRKELKSQSALDSLVSREAAFLFNNLVLVGAAFAILWGTLFPVLSEWVRGTKITVGPPFFNSVMIPIGLLLLLLTGIGPMVAWRKTTPEQLKRNFLWPVLVTILTSIAVLFVSHKPYVIAAFSFCAFVLMTIFLEYERGIRVRMRNLKEGFLTAFLRLLVSNPRRYGGYIVHFGVVLMFIGFTGGAFNQEKEFQFNAGETRNIGNYTLTFNGLQGVETPHKQVVRAEILVKKNGKSLPPLHPARVFYVSQIQGEEAQADTQVSIRRTLGEDLYLVLLEFDPQNNSAFINAIINPLIQFIWIGGLFLVLGTVVVMWPNSNSRTSSKGDIS